MYVCIYIYVYTYTYKTMCIGGRHLSSLSQRLPVGPQDDCLHRNLSNSAFRGVAKSRLRGGV